MPRRIMLYTSTVSLHSCFPPPKLKRPFSRAPQEMWSRPQILWVCLFLPAFQFCLESRVSKSVHGLFCCAYGKWFVCVQCYLFVTDVFAHFLHFKKMETFTMKTTAGVVLVLFWSCAFPGSFHLGAPSSPLRVSPTGY